MAKLPRKSENPYGLHKKYYVNKIYMETDKDAVYIPLRVDMDDEDTVWTRCCRNAIRGLARDLIRCRQDRHIKLANDLIKLVDRIEEEG